jgi:hypothetical protein
MKIYYNFHPHHLNFSLSPYGKKQIDENDEVFYPDCHSVEVSGNEFKIYVIRYEDGDRDYLNDSPENLAYFEEQMEKVFHKANTITNNHYEKFGFNVTESVTKCGDNYFIETTWIKGT